MVFTNTTHYLSTAKGMPVHIQYLLVTLCQHCLWRNTELQIDTSSELSLLDNARYS
jgi:hypothetical protein